MDGWILMVNTRGWSFSLGSNDPVWIVVKPEMLGDRKIPHSLCGEIWWHPCLLWPSDLVEIMVNHVITYLLCWPSDTMWIELKPGFYL